MRFDIAVDRRIGAARISATVVSDAGLVVLAGPSGAGKTSVLNMVAGLLRPDAGHVRVGGATLFDEDARVNVLPERRRAGYVFQDARLFPHLRVRANLLYGWRLVPAEERWMALEEAVRFLGIGHLLDRWPRTLSGGEARRVAIGRALLAGPRFLLLDEPLSFLDPPRRAEIAEVIERVRDELQLPILMVTHDEREAERLAGEVVRM